MLSAEEKLTLTNKNVLDGFERNSLNQLSFSVGCRSKHASHFDTSRQKTHDIRIMICELKRGLTPGQSVLASRPTIETEKNRDGFATQQDLFHVFQHDGSWNDSLSHRENVRRQASR